MLKDESITAGIHPVLDDYYLASKDVSSMLAPAGWTLLSRSDKVDLTPAQDAQEGFEASAYSNPAGQILCAFRPTLLSLGVFGRGTLADDVKLAQGITPPSFNDAVTFVSTVMQAAAKINETARTAGKPEPYDLRTIFVTGHSLGGAEAEYVAQQAAENPSSPLYAQTVVGVTFAAPGIPQLPDSATERPSGRLVNLVLPGDPVANFAADINPAFAPPNLAHYGRVVVANGTEGLFRNIEGLLREPLVNGIESLSPSGSFLGGLGVAFRMIAEVVEHHGLHNYAAAFLKPQPGSGIPHA